MDNIPVVDVPFQFYTNIVLVLVYNGGVVISFHDFHIIEVLIVIIDQLRVVGNQFGEEIVVLEVLHGGMCNHKGYLVYIFRVR